MFWVRRDEAVWLEQEAHIAASSDKSEATDAEKELDKFRSMSADDLVEVVFSCYCHCVRTVGCRST